MISYLIKYERIASSEPMNVLYVYKNAVHISPLDLTKEEYVELHAQLAAKNEDYSVVKCP